MLDTLRHIEDAKLVVLDTRGNRGGNSLVGPRILSALLGEAFVESLGQSSHSYAMWRVSALALATLDSALASMQGNHEKNNDAYTFVSGMRESMNAALVGKQDWLRQPDTSSLDQGLVKDSSPVRFKGDRVPGSGVTEPAEGALRAKEDGHRGSWLTLSLRRPNTHQRNHDDQAHYRIDRVG